MKNSIAFLALLFSFSFAHMEMEYPAPRRSKFSSYYTSIYDVDYSMTAPLSNTDSSQFPCKGYAKGPSTLTLTAGSPLTVELYGSAIHGGGHCQFAMSYDGGNTWVVLSTVVRQCMLQGLNFSVPIPASAPNGAAVFAWTWINAIGNREYYMNCADVTVQGGATPGSITGPKLFVANLAYIAGAPTIPEFPDPTSTNDGRNYLDARPTITVTGTSGPAGSTTGSQPATTGSQPATTGSHPAGTTGSQATTSTGTHVTGPATTGAKDSTVESDGLAATAAESAASSFLAPATFLLAVFSAAVIFVCF
jgi:hypothetical protein